MKILTRLWSMERFKNESCNSGPLFSTAFKFHFSKTHLPEFEAYKDLKKTGSTQPSVASMFSKTYPQSFSCLSTVKRPPRCLHNIGCTPRCPRWGNLICFFNNDLPTKKIVQGAIPVGIRHFQLALLQLERRLDRFPRCESRSTYPLPPRHVTPPRNKTMILQWQTKKNTGRKKTGGQKQQFV